jgi:hypothetical protein
MNKDIMKLFFPEMVSRVEIGLCADCAAPMDEALFKDERSKQEFEISGLCQVCQDKAFGGNLIKGRR